MCAVEILERLRQWPLAALYSFRIGQQSVRFWNFFFVGRIMLADRRSVLANVLCRWECSFGCQTSRRRMELADDLKLQRTCWR